MSNLEVVRLRQQVADLEYQVRELKRILSPKYRFPQSLGLTKSQQIALDSILACAPHPATRDRIHAALYFDRDEAPDSRLIDSLVSRVRRALRPHKISIRSARGIGYSMPQPDAEKLRAMLT